MGKISAALRIILLAASFIYVLPVPVFSAPPKAPFPGLTILYSVDERGEIEPCG